MLRLRSALSELALQSTEARAEAAWRFATQGVLPHIDTAVRRELEGGWIAPAAIESLEILTGADELAVAVLSGDPDGFVRAAALRRLDREAAVLSLPFAILRLTDWVEQVRVRAEEFVLRRTRPEYAAVLVGCLGLLSRVEQRSRIRPQVVARIRDLLGSSECRSALEDGVQSSDRDVRMECYRLAPDKCARALNDPDVAIRKWAFRLGPEALCLEPGDWMSRAAADRYGPIRQLGFEALALAGVGGLGRFLLDPSGAIRGACQRMLAHHSETPPAGFYRAVIQEAATRTTGAKTIAVAALALGETGDPSNAPIVAALLTHRSARVRKAAIRAASLLRIGTADSVLLSMVEGDTRACARESARLLLSRGTSPELIWAAASPNPHPLVAASVLRLFRAIGKWRQLRFYLEAASSGNPDFMACAVTMIEIWLQRSNSSFAQPSLEEIRVLREAFLRVRTSLPAAQQCGLEFTLRTL